jgi:D-alanine-D-alanine ligase
MAPDDGPARLPVVLLHNLDPAWGPDDAGGVREAVGHLMAALRAEGHRVIEAPVASADLGAALAHVDPAGCIVFNWCEELPGRPHSDVQVARMLEERGFTYTGSTAEVLAASWDKAAVKTRLAGSGIPTPRWRICDGNAAGDWHAFPAIVKPAYEHSSTGVDTNAVVLDAAALRRRVAYVREAFRQPAMVEDFIDGREFHVTLWGNGRVHMLPPAEMDFSAFADVRDRLCTYDAKFTPGSAHYEGIQVLLPAVLTAAESAAIAGTATRAYRRVGCRDYARLDLRLREGIFYVLDVNPNPDVSPDTSLAYAAEAAGLSYGAFASRLVSLAAARHPAQRNRS